MQDLSCNVTQDCLNYLLGRNKHQIGINYQVDAADVNQAQLNQAQLDNAQDIIDDLTKKLKSKKFSRDELNLLLNELHNIIPRIMRNVKNYLISGGMSELTNVVATLRCELAVLSQLLELNKKDSMLGGQTDIAEVIEDDITNISVQIAEINFCIQLLRDDNKVISKFFKTIDQ
jgi:myosin-crossreactive antigen